MGVSNMALGFTKNTNNGEEFLPSFRFNAVSGDSVIAGSKKNAAGEFEKYETEVKFPVKLIFDMENIEVGWMHFAATGPSFAMGKLGQPLPERPTPDHKQGFRVKLFNKTLGLSMFSNSSRTIAEVMDILHDAYVTGAAKNVGKVPVVEIKGTKKIAVKTKEGSKNYKQPDWSIVSWVVRPDELLEKQPEPVKEENTLEDDAEF
jgi:hypothetical protein